MPVLRTSVWPKRRPGPRPVQSGLVHFQVCVSSRKTSSGARQCGVLLHGPSECTVTTYEIPPCTYTQSPSPSAAACSERGDGTQWRCFLTPPRLFGDLLLPDLRGDGPRCLLGDPSAACASSHADVWSIQESVRVSSVWKSAKKTSWLYILSGLHAQ